ncbi:hypothetical protein HU200_010326 [Digitaria exilis]|uniref:Ig-like domain-containing protein n=1 Tax=Digitaria exilis TaxID=1010633 RepID=A0A835KNL0_9POAL|nr:hypothetical protein HU200_010326 [Digitaria exilis]
MLVPISHLPAAAPPPRLILFLRRPQPPSTRPTLSSQPASHPPITACPPTPPHPKLPTPTHMDPDQVAAATGVQSDDLGDTTSSADGGCGGGGSGSGDGDSWARALLRRGWDFSRKAAIAGVAATAAPVVAPPLLVLSVAGVALSLPFAAYLATFFATERLMAALLPPPPRAQPYHNCDWDLEDDEFVDAPEAPGGEVLAHDYWNDAEDDTIMEEDERYASLPLSRECRFSEHPVQALNDDHDAMSEGEFRFRESGRGSSALDNRSEKEEENEYITMEAQALPSRGVDDSRSAAPKLCEEEDKIPIIVEAPVAAVEPIQALSASDNGDKIEIGKRTAMEEMDSSKEMVPPGIDINIDTTEISDFPVLVLGKHDTVVQTEAECEVSVRKSGQDSLVSDTGDRTEEMPQEEVNVSESLVPHDNTLQSKMEGDVAVEMVLEEVTINTDHATEGFGLQMDAIATELPESESLHPSDLVAQEPQGMREAAYVNDILESNLTEDIVLDIGDTNIEGVGQNGEENVSSVISVVTVDDVLDLSCSTSTPNVSAISDDDMMKIESRPDLDCPNKRTGMENTWVREGSRNKEVVENKVSCSCFTPLFRTSIIFLIIQNSAKTEENKSVDCNVPTRSMALQDTDVSPMQDDQSKREDDVTVEMVLEEVTSTTDLDKDELVGVQVDIIASGSGSLPVSDLVAQELQAVTEAAVVDDIQGSTAREDIATDIDNTNTGGVEHHSERGASSFISGASLVTMDDAGDVMCGRREPYVSGISEDIKRVKGRVDIDQHPLETTGFEDKLMNEGLKRDVLAEDKDNYSKEQLREQLDTLRTITGYRPATCLTLEDEIAGLYIFVGVEPPASSRDDSDLTEINVKLRFLKSIIGVE